MNFVTFFVAKFNKVFEKQSDTECNCFQENLLTLMKELPMLLELLKHLFRQFNYKLDKKGARKLTIGEAIGKFDKGYFSEFQLSF